MSLQKHIFQEAPPKKPLTAYFLFLGDERQQIMKNNPGSRISEITQIAARMWSELDQKKKEEYQKRTEELQKEYEVKKKEYEVKFGEIKKKSKKKKHQNNDDDQEYEKKITKKVRK
ncbi:unnamed protein product [Paramecium primaurelia]|uniref:HMG box domain-containing protein n=2 Tax=Paramecium TaxID=5884 RepID=A0A8S1Y165_9CILI|nr:unnamed protein product [Paramecium primaurelia]CAD8205374.1 unnamed protein product [Paramecium pentaurelia]